MDFIHHTIQWVKGEVLQGRIMLGIGILAIIGFLYFANFQQSFYKGTILPFILLLLVLLGYGGFQVFMRPKHIEKVQQEIQINPVNAHKIELEKAQKDDKAYTRLKPIWAVLFIVSLVLFFVLKNEFGKGMSFGFVLWFLVALLFDSFLHHRLKTYLSALQQFS